MSNISDPVIYVPLEPISANCKHRNCQGGGKAYLNKVIAAPKPNERVHVEYHIYCTGCKRWSHTYNTISKNKWLVEKLNYEEKTLLSSAGDVDNVPCPRTGDLFDV